MKRMIAILMAAAMTFGMSACKKEIPVETEAPTEKPVTLEVITSYGGDDGNRRNFEDAIASYEEKTGNIVVDRSSNSNEEWKARVMTDFMTGSEPDVLFYFSNADADPFVNAGKVVSIEEIREEYPDYATNMKESMMAEAPDGKHYSVPSNGYWESLFVNRTVLNQCGIPVPGPNYTWKQFLADCQVIKDHGFIPIACSLFEVPHYWFEFAVMNNGTVENHLDKPRVDRDGKLIHDAAAEKWIAGLNDIKDLYERGFFPENTLTATDTETVNLFAEGEAAFMVDGSWKIGYLTQHYPGNLQSYAVSYVPGKKGRSASDAVGGISMGYFITRKAWEDPAKREAAVQFVFHMTSEEMLSTFVTTEVTALIGGAKPTGLNVLQKSAAETVQQFTGVTPAVQDNISSDAKSDLFSNIQKVVTGQMDAETAVESAMKLN